jgi:S-adenosylmethionine:tRNA ribosyltransferase-isomerase
MSLDIKLFDYKLSPGRIALYPAEPRDSSRLMYLPRMLNEIGHLHFTDFPDCLSASDLLVINDSKVFPARLRGQKIGSGGKVEVFLLQKLDDGIWEALVRPGRRLPPGTEVEFFDNKLRAQLGERTESGGRKVKFDCADDLLKIIWEHGEVPLPPYIDRLPEEEDKYRYQTVYAQNVGAVAAPTAGFHFTESILERLKNQGVEVLKLTLHPGLGTFRPITRTDVDHHQMHEEAFCIPEETANAINDAKKTGKRVIAVGTTSVRALEAACDIDGVIIARGWRETNLFIKPPYSFKVIDGMLTNFHLPKSTLLLMVCAYAGRERIMAAYKEAIDKGYRFYSYGDAMLIL